MDTRTLHPNTLPPPPWPAPLWREDITIATSCRILKLFDLYPPTYPDPFAAEYSSNAYRSLVHHGLSLPHSTSARRVVTYCYGAMSIHPLQTRQAQQPPEETKNATLRPAAGVHPGSLMLRSASEQATDVGAAVRMVPGFSTRTRCRGISSLTATTACGGSTWVALAPPRTTTFMETGSRNS
ncbi:hypothetical protein FN846DRAFT_1014283 [Sphaerosporella brunnea]|uniref:Uncharacterized protein n=1 Tax=Sphaerosporella brunnea TaxID=1250544 RepID=A0A5J5EWP4_9PEZI|nr:hypothetical protein FN846DRAFT_1014283 [Sphaerosporella brunnea]